GGPRLWLVTRGAQPAGPSPSSVAVAQAPLWGLGRVLALERPECWGGLVDLDPGEDADAAPRLMEELTQADGEDQVAFRRGERRVARLVRAPLENEAGGGGPGGGADGEGGGRPERGGPGRGTRGGGAGPGGRVRGRGGGAAAACRWGAGARRGGPAAAPPGASAPPASRGRPRLR